jgi:hypothetical protein
VSLHRQIGLIQSSRSHNDLRRNLSSQAIVVADVGQSPAMSRSIRKMRFQMDKPVGLSRGEGPVVEDGSAGQAGTIPEPRWIRLYTR